jgi:cell division protein ZipA
MLQDNLRFTLTIIGIFVIAAILLHGLWTIRKSKKNNKKGRSSFESHNWEPDFEHEDDLEAEGPIFDDVGVSKARVIVNPQSSSSNSGANSSQTAINNLDSFSTTNNPVTTDSLETESQLNAADTGTLDKINEDASPQSAPVGIGRAFYEDNDIDKEQVTPFVSVSDESENQTQLPKSKDADGETGSHSASTSELNSETSANDDSADANSANSDTATKVTIATNASDGQDTEDSSASIATRATDIDTSPVYSNVVTQPKPEFTRANTKKDTLETDFGQPPEFLLKKQQAESEANASGQAALQEGAEQQLPNTNQTNAPDKLESRQNESLSDTQSVDKGPDFSLNIQEGPSLPKHQAKEHQALKNEPEVTKPGVEKELSFAEKAKRLVRRSKKTVAENIRKEPVLKNAPSDDQMRIDFESSADTDSVKDDSSVNSSANVKQEGLFSADDANVSSQSGSQAGQSNPNKESQSGVQNDVLVLNVRANNDKPIEGAALLPMLLTLGFKFGEHDIFHRHVHSNGKGPILFSLTNMFKPGVFDIDNLENFNTLGISLFMMLPIDADAQQVFNMMHNAARKLADEFDCRILDGNKVGLSKQSLQQYSERIREFERKRSI